MFYKQTINNIKVVILSLDGGLLDLNRLRYNYFKRICKTNNFELTKEDFEKNLGNMKTMYNNYPITKEISSDDINKLIERDLYEYAKLKPDTIKKEGTDELLQFFKQKDIKIAVISSHRIKRAIQYLQLTRLYDKVDFVIGGDSDNPPLPDPSLLNITLEQLNCTNEEALVVANYPNLLYGANSGLINTIYLSDLCQAKDDILPRVFKLARNNFEVINIFLFARYDSMEMFSPLLGMSADMDLTTLEQTYEKLLKEYQNDAQLVKLVRNTYHYFLAKIVQYDTVPKEPKVEEPVVDDDSFANPQKIASLEKSVEVLLDEELTPEKSTEELADIIKRESTKRDLSRHKIPDETFSDIPKRKTMYQGDEFSLTKTAIGCDPQRVNELMDIINGNAPKIEEDVSDKRDIDIINDEPVNDGTVSHLINFIYTLVVVTLVSFIGLLVFIGFEDFITGPGTVSGIIKSIIDIYVNIVLSTYAFIFNGLNSLLSFIPDYLSLISGTELLSTMAIKLILFIIFNLILVYIFKMLYLLLTEVEDDDVDFAEN